MSNYLELKVPIREDAMWFRQLRKAVAAAGISETSVRWQRQHHHITAAFINDDGLAEPLAAAFDRLLSSCEPPMLTFDKVDAFMAKDAPVIIVNLTSTKPSPALMALIQSLRKAASDLGADLAEAPTGILAVAGQEKGDAQPSVAEPRDEITFAFPQGPLKRQHGVVYASR